MTLSIAKQQDLGRVDILNVPTIKKLQILEETMYDFDTNDSASFFKWNYIFRMLSLENFDPLSSLIGFPQVSKETKRIARDFVITFAKEHNIPCPFFAVNTLLDNSENTLNRNQILLHNVFNLLEAKGEAEKVYYWGNNTYDNYDYKDVASLLAVGRLMRECTITQSQKNNIQSTNRILKDKQISVTNHWISIYLSNPHAILPDVNPPNLTNTELRIFYDIIFQFEYERFIFKEIIEQLSSSLTKWDEFAIQGGLLGGWLSLEGKFKITITELNTIASELDFKVIENWIKSYVGIYEDLVLPLKVLDT